MKTLQLLRALGHGPSALNRAVTILHSISSDLPATWISGISCTISRSCTVKISIMFRVMQGSGAWRSEALWV